MKKILLTLFIIPLFFSCDFSAESEPEILTCMMESYCKYKKTFERGEGFTRDSWGYCYKTRSSNAFCSIKCAGCHKEAYK